jgi:hypothetical protein
MDKNTKSPSDAIIGPRELLIASLIVALWLAAFGIGYWGGRDIGSVIFN